MKPSPAKPIVLLCAVAAMLALAAPATAAARVSAVRARASSLLFVQETDRGSIVKVGPGAFRLTLDGVSPSVSTFTDRPHRRAGVEGLSGFVHGWSADGFGADPPNAALVVHRAPRSRDVALLTLAHPRYDRRRETLTYRATPLHGTGARSLAALAKRADPVRTRRFGGASLFIDDGNDTAYEHVTLRFSQVLPGFGNRLVVSVGSADPPSWSLGPPGGSASGLQLDSPEEALPISQYAVDPGVLSITLNQAEALPVPYSFSVGLYLEGSSTTGDFFLTATGNPSAQVTAQVGSETPRSVLSSPTPFGWPSP